ASDTRITIACQDGCLGHLAMRRHYDHIDLRVRNLAEVRSFYEVLLPALGFTRDATIEGWLQFESDDADGVTEFFGVSESLQHVANECGVAFWADSTSEVDKLAEIAVRAGARTIEGPAYEIPQTGETVYYPVL